MPTEELRESLIRTRDSKGQERSSSSNLTVTQKTLNGLDKLLKLLPTGTIFVFMSLVPILSNNGKCALVNKILTSILTAVCGLFCALASFTDRYTDSNGKTHYGIVTTKGLWTFNDSDSDSVKEEAQYKLKFADFVHAGFSVLVFSVVTILNSNTVDCFYPSLESYENTLMAVLPAVVSAVASLMFVLFPVTRHGIGLGTRSSTSGQSTGD